MKIPPLEAGLVINYRFLWSHDKNRGLEEGVKDRPCVVIAINKMENGNSKVLVLPITHTPPEKGMEESKVKIPSALKKHLGMDAADSWISITEVNKFTWVGPDYSPTPRGNSHYGFIPSGLFGKIQDQFLAKVSRQLVKIINRDIPGKAPTL